jgi:HAD superfamily phosphoserine phosphatase-like hydrolase
MSQKFAVFDIDGTVIRWQFYHAIVDELSNLHLLKPEAAAKISDARLTWKQRSHKNSFHDYEQTMVDVYQEARSSIKVSDFDAAVGTVFETYKDQVYTYTRDLIRSLKSEDYLLFAVSGSQQEIVEKFGVYYGFDAVVGSVYARTAEGVLGQTISSPVIDGKGPVLRRLIKQYGVSTDGSYAVGDSASDAAMLELVDNPIAFNPDSNLFSIAKGHDWKVVVERKNMTYELEPANGAYLLKG